MKKLTFAIFALLGLSTIGAFAQDSPTDAHTITITIPNVTLLDIEPGGSTNINQVFVAPTEAGLTLVAPAANSGLWLNYTSVVPSGVNRKIVVKYTTAALGGVSVKVTPGAPIITGGGSGGLSGGPVTLTTADQSIVTGIASVFTGNGINSGVNLTYDLDVITGSFGSLIAAVTAISVTYTLMDM